MSAFEDSTLVWHISAPDTLGRALGFAHSEPPSLATILLADIEHGPGQQFAKAVWNSRNRVRVIAAPAMRMNRFASELASGSCLPVGNGAYVRQAMDVTGIEPPVWNCYPAVLDSHMRYRAHRTSASNALRWPKPVFVKPAVYGQFRGFVMRDDCATMSEDDNRQLDRLLGLPRREPVWVCHPLEISSNWRYYVHRGDVAGYARLAGPERPEPHPEEVSAIVAAGPSHLAYALDIAVLKDGATALLGARDAWGLEPISGPNAPAPIDLLRMLWSRWRQLYQRGQQPISAGQS
jgi:hypothetical protein